MGVRFDESSWIQPTSPDVNYMYDFIITDKVLGNVSPSNWPPAMCTTQSYYVDVYSLQYIYELARGIQRYI